MKQYIFTIMSILFLSIQANAQELNCKVTVNFPSLQTADPAVFKTLENNINNFMNNTRWTNDDFASEERIECSLNINIMESPSSDRYKAEATIQSGRPVYNSSYSTVGFVHQDNAWDFDYVQFQNIQYDKNGYLDELSSLLAFYAYIILAFDYDSFKLEGGTKMYENAQNVINNARNGGRDGWKGTDTKRRNRFWLVDNMMSAKFKGLREAYYKYHIEGLDVMYNSSTEGRQAILAALQLVDKTARENPNSMGIMVFRNIKGDEIVDIFTDGSVPPVEQTKVGNMLSKFDPSSAQKLRASSRNAVGKPGSSTVPRVGTSRTAPKGRD